MGARRYSQPAWNTVKQLFKDQSTTKFIIPVYQRNYVWEVKSQVKKLLGDYYALLNNKDDVTHFLGIIIDYNAGKKDRVERYYVIDGQQRLTTLFLLIAALRERAIKENNENVITELDYWMNINFNQNSKNYNPKLEPLSGDREVFNKIIYGRFDTLSDGEKNSKISQAYIYILNFFMNTLAKIEIVELIEVLDRFLLVEIPLDREDNAQQIFETINHSGSKLLATDLIRNYVLMCADDDKMDYVFERTWRPFESKFEDSKELEKFFYFFLINQFKESIKASDTYERFRLWLDDNRTARSVEEAIEYASKYADVYIFLYKTPLYLIKDETLWKALKDFRNIQSDMPAPMMMEIAYLYKSNYITSTQFIEVLSIVTSFLLRRAIVGMDTSGITMFFRTVLKNITALVDEDYSNLVDVVKYCFIDDTLTKAMRTPSDEELKQELENKNVYDFPLALHCFFDKYENEKVSNPTETMNYQIEHIMPRDGEKWYAQVGLSKEEYELHVNRLGNLTLTTKHDNPKMSNKLFDYKKEILKSTAHFRLNKDVYNEPLWSLNEINKRNLHLIEEIIRLYPYETSDKADDYRDILSNFRKLPRMDKLIEWGIVSVGDEVYLKRYKETSKAILVSENQVDYNGEILKISQWISKLYGFQSGINAYREICPMSSEDSLDILRLQYLNDHPEMDNSFDNKKEVVVIRNELAILIRTKLHELSEKFDLIVVSEQNSYLRFTNQIIREKVGLNGNGEWDKLKDLVLVEIHNSRTDGVSAYVMMGPSNNQEIRLKWHNFALNTPELGGRYKNMRRKWDMLSKNTIRLSKNYDEYSTKEAYFEDVLLNLTKFITTQLPLIVDAFKNAPADNNDPVYTSVRE